MSPKNPDRFHSFHLAGKISVEPLGKLSYAWAGGKVPEGSRVFLYRTKGQGTTPFYLYTRRYPQHKNKLCYVLDFRWLPKLPPEEQIDTIIHNLGKRMVWAKDVERVIVKYHGGWQIEKRVHMPAMKGHGRVIR